MQTASPSLRARSPQHGFTLPELMITLALVGVLLTLGVPSMRTFMQNNRLSSAANDLLRSLQLARSEAIKRQDTVIVCASSDPTAASPTCSYGAFRGWIVVQDSNKNWQRDGTELVLERHELIDPNVTVNNDNDGIQSFNTFGFANPTGTKTPSYNIVFCDSRGLQSIGTDSVARAMLITQTGRARVTKLDTQVSAALAATGGTCP